MTKLIFSLLLAAIAASTAKAQDWRAIKPLASTCQDVERVLGGKACGKSEVEHKLPIGLLYVYFENGGCKDERRAAKYNVPPGTVISVVIFIHPPNRVFLSDLDLDVSKLKKGDPGDVVGLVKYVSEELGVYIDAGEDGQVISVVYGPPSKYDRLLCIPKPAPNNGRQRTRAQDASYDR